MGKLFFRNIRYFFFYFLFWGADAFFTPYLVVFLDEIGMNGTRIGVVTGISYLVNVLGAVTVGLLADRLGKPQRVMIACVLLADAAVLMTTGARHFAVLILTCSLYSFFALPCIDLCDKLLLDGIRDTPSLFSLMRIGGSVGYGIGILLAGAAVARQSAKSAQKWALPVFLVCAALAWSLLRKPVPAAPYESRVIPKENSSSFTSRSHFPLRHIFSRRISWGIYLALLFVGFAESGGAGYLTRDVMARGFSPEFASALILACMAGQIFMFFLMPSVQRRAPAPVLIAAGFLASALRLFALAFVHVLPVWLQFTCQFIGGFSSAFIVPSLTVLIAFHFSGMASNTAQALKTVMNKGFGSCIGVFLHGWMYSFLDPSAAMAFFGGGAVLFAAALFLLFRSLLKEDQ